jgi:hypothetical protein
LSCSIVAATANAVVVVAEVMGTVVVATVVAVGVVPVVLADNDVGDGAHLKARLRFISGSGT